MTRIRILLLLAASMIAASCAPTIAPPPAVTPTGADRFLIDPRTGYDSAAVPPAVDRRFDAAWRFALAGDDFQARKLLTEILAKNPDYRPATLAGAAIDIRAGRLDAAQAVVDELRITSPGYAAAKVYEAEIAVRQGRTRFAYDLYRALAAEPGAPSFAAERIAELQQTLFNDLYTAAQAAPDAEAIRLLREALAVDASAVEPRILLAQKLVAAKQWDEARRELEPLLNTSASRTEVQEALAEIEVGRGRYEEAILRYDRLARRTNDPRHQRRLAEIKQEWSAANMPAHFRTALSSAAITRAEFATLLYWTVPAIRFAQNLATPPIAVDIEDVAGREEMIRAIAIGLFEVDPVTRRVAPSRQVTAGRLSAHLARVLSIRRAPCAQGLTGDRVLAACGVNDPLATHAPDDTVTGREALAALQQVAKLL